MVASTLFSVMESMLPATLHHKFLLHNLLFCILIPMVHQVLPLPLLQMLHKLLVLLHALWIPQVSTRAIPLLWHLGPPT